MTHSIPHIAAIISPYNRGEKALFKVLTNLKKRLGTAPIPALYDAIDHLAPGLKVLSQIKAGRNVYFPAYLTKKSSIYYAVRWCLHTESAHTKIRLAQRITSNLLDAQTKTGHAYKLKKDLNESVLWSRVNMKSGYVYTKPTHRHRNFGKTAEEKHREIMRQWNITKPVVRNDNRYLTDEITPITRIRVAETFKKIEEDKIKKLKTMEEIDEENKKEFEELEKLMFE